LTWLDLQTSLREVVCSIQVLDDQTFAALQSVMLFNNVEILTKLQHDPSFFPDLFKKLRTTPPKVPCLTRPKHTVGSTTFFTVIITM